MDTQGSRGMVEDFVRAQGWSDDSVICLLCEYLDLMEDDPITLREFLQAKANFENDCSTDSCGEGGSDPTCGEDCPVATRCSHDGAAEVNPGEW